LWLNLKRTLDKRRGKVEVVRSWKKVITFQKAMAKKKQKRSSVFQDKNRVTPSVAARGDTNSGDATGNVCVMRLHDCHLESG